MKRRTALFLLCLILIGTAALSGCGSEPPRKRYQTAYLSFFDTVTTVIGYEPDEKTFREKAELIAREMETYDRLYDIYQEYPGLTNLCVINRSPGVVLKVDPKIIDLLLFAQRVDSFSGHRTDVTFGPVLRLWHEKREYGMSHPEEAALPERDMLETAAKHTGFQFLQIDPAAGTVCLTDPEASLDVGAIAKGYAVQKVCEALPEGYLISAGGNVAATGAKPDGSSWTVGIQDPDSGTEQYCCKVSISRGSVVTSGDYQRFYTVDGVRYHHIIDPETLFPSAYWRSVTIITEDSALGDALSTTLFLMNLEEGQALAASLGAEVMWIGLDGKTWYSPGFETYLTP